MVDMGRIVQGIRKALVANSPALLAGAGVLGTMSTAYLTAMASFRAADIIRRYEEDYEWPINQREKLLEQAKLVGSLYVPAAVSGVLTAGCVIGSTKISNRRTASAAL